MVPSVGNIFGDIVLTLRKSNPVLVLVCHYTLNTLLRLLFSVALHLPSTCHDVLCHCGDQSEDNCLTRVCLKDLQDSMFQVNPFRLTMFVIRRLLRLLMRWVYFPFLAS